MIDEPIIRPTEMSAIKLANKLRVKLKILKAARPGEIAKYRRALTAWRRDMAAWIEAHGKARVMKISDTELREHDERYRYTGYADLPAFNHVQFFDGAPRTPLYPKASREKIAAIQKALRHLAITGQKTVKVDSEMIEKFFNDTLV